MTGTLEGYREDFVKDFRSLGDSIAADNPMFGFSKYGKQLATYVTSEDLPTPLTIGLNGKWGSGKTTMTRIIQNEIDQINNDSDMQDGKRSTHVDYVDFNAWHAEKTDLSYSLWNIISEHYSNNSNGVFRNSDKVKEVGKFLLDVASRKIANMSLDEANKYFENLSNVKLPSDEISKLVGDNRLIVFIDDLDRCDASNIIDLLEVIKNVLNIDKLVFFVTVDISKIERAWELRYNNVGKIESKEYIEKLFPIIFSLPPKNIDDIYAYHRSLVQLDKKYDNIHIHLVNSLSDNPRKIKRMLNLVFFLIQNYDLKYIETHDDEHSFRECRLHFALIITWVTLTVNHKKISRMFKLQPSAIVVIALLFSEASYFSTFKQQYLDFLASHSSDFYVPRYTGSCVFESALFTPLIKDIRQYA